MSEPVLVAAADAARQAFGERLIAAYALGSLAHGGYSPLVSDIDLGLVLEDPLEAGDDGAVASLASSAERLSVFWGSPSTLRGESHGGRFPAVDRLDLVDHGRLLLGSECRAGIPRPPRSELVAEGPTFAVDKLGPPPSDLATQGARAITKRVLFPVRFLYTEATGAIGRNEDAVAWYLAEERSANDLVAAAYRWREVEPDPSEAAPLLEALPALDRELAEAYGLEGWP